VEEGACYKTFHIDSKLFLEELKIEAMLRGVKFVQKKFDSLREMLELKEAAIFNCTNYSSGYLFEEEGTGAGRRSLCTGARARRNSSCSVWEGREFCR